MCTGNSMKTVVSDAADCDSCDGTSNVPNTGHTACGKRSWGWDRGSNCVALIYWLVVWILDAHDTL